MTVEVMKSTDHELADYLRQALEDGEHDREKATSHLIKMASEIPGLRQLILESYPFDRLCRYLITEHVSHSRQAAWRSVKHPPANPPSINLFQVAQDRLLNQSLPNGRPLGKATLIDLEEAITHHGKHEIANGRARIWYTLIKAQIKKGQLVEDVLTEDALTELQLEAQKKVDEATQ